MFPKKNPTAHSKGLPRDSAHTPHRHQYPAPVPFRWGVAETIDRFVTLTGCRLDNVLNSVITTRSLLVSSALALCLFLGCADSAMPKSPTPATPSTPQIQHTKALSSSPTQVRTFTPDSRESALVTRVIDGDTVEVSLNGKSQTVRYIGIDTPETKHPSKPIECFGPEASQFNEELVAGKQVLLEEDITDRDRYGRLLRYVWLEEVGLVNQILVENGYARVSTYPPDVKYEPLLIAAESLAQADGIGRWSACSEPSPSHVDRPVSGARQEGANCSPYYLTLCVPPFPPDLDCDAIEEAHFPVLKPDPHGLDADGDGIGCER